MKTVLLLIASNVFMTFAWYGHLKFRAVPLWQAIAVSWFIALFEYCLQVPANRYGYGAFTATQLKIMQEVITLSVFFLFAIFYLGEKMRWNYLASFGLLVAAVVVGMWPSDASGTAAPSHGASSTAPAATANASTANAEH